MIGAGSKPNPFHEVWTDRLRGWLGDLDSNQGCPGQSREFYR